MQKINSRSKVVLFMFLWTSMLKLCQSNHTNCDFTESYNETVTVSVKETVLVTKYKWCLEIPPRCPVTKKENRIVHKNSTVPKTRTVKQCCKDQIQLYNDCIPKCTERQCPNIQCEPDTDKCQCKPGYTGQLCRKRCEVGFWGESCMEACDELCANNCDFRDGRCCEPDNRSSPCVVGHRRSATTPRPSVVLSSNVRTVRQESRNAPMVEAPASVPPTVEAVTAVTPSSPPPLPAASTPTREDVGGFYKTTVTNVQVTMYKYDELVKKLLWISAMTVVAIAMVFVIMFVVFFNCYGTPKTPQQRPTAMAAASDKIHETCISTQNPAFASDRYTKAPTHQTMRKDDLPIHPEIFCPIFSAPHHTGGSSLYDSPQPLYEIIC